MPIQEKNVLKGSGLATLALAAALAAPMPAAYAQTPQQIVDRAAGGKDAFLPDFSYAGYDFGSAVPPSRGRVIDAADYGAAPSDGIDDSAAIQDALREARKTRGPVTLRFDSGRYLVTEVLNLDRSDLVLQGRGQGKGGTELHFPRPLAMVDTGTRFDELREYLSRYEKRQREADRNLDVLFSEYSWTGGFLWVGREGARPVPYLKKNDEKPAKAASGIAGERGGRELEVDDASALESGQWVTVAWYSSEEGSGIINSIYGGTDLEVGSHHWSFAERPLVRHRTKIEGIDGNVLTLASPLPHPVSGDVPAEIVAWEPLERIGIEDLSLTFPEAAVFGHHVERGYNGVYFTGSADGWMRDVTIRNADAGVLTDDSAHLTFSDLRFEGDRKGHYALHMGSVNGVLAERLSLFAPVIHSLTFNTKSMRSVFKDAVVWSEPVIDQHAGSNHQNLFDNITMRLRPERVDGQPEYKVFDGSGAGYWQPGHGRYNTTWNLRLVVEGGMSRDETLRVLGLAEGPDARIVGLSANRPVELDYRPEPLVASLGEPVSQIPSLYDYQRAARSARAMAPGGSATGGRN